MSFSRRQSEPLARIQPHVSGRVLVLGLHRSGAGGRPAKPQKMMTKSQVYDKEDKQRHVYVCKTSEKDDFGHQKMNAYQKT